MFSQHIHNTLTYHYKQNDGDDLPWHCSFRKQEWKITWLNGSTSTKSENNNSGKEKQKKNKRKQSASMVTLTSCIMLSSSIREGGYGHYGWVAVGVSEIVHCIFILSTFTFYLVKKKTQTILYNWIGFSGKFSPSKTKNKNRIEMNLLDFNELTANQ